MLLDGYDYIVKLSQPLPSQQEAEAYLYPAYNFRWWLVFRIVKMCRHMKKKRKRTPQKNPLHQPRSRLYFMSFATRWAFSPSLQNFVRAFLRNSIETTRCFSQVIFCDKNPLDELDMSILPGGCWWNGWAATSVCCVVKNKLRIPRPVLASKWGASQKGRIKGKS